MAVYVDSAAVGANDGTSWADAYTTLGSTETVASGEIYVSSTHSESEGAAISWEWESTSSDDPLKILSVDSSDDSLAAGATITTGVGNYALRLGGDAVYFYGITWKYGDELDIAIVNQMVYLEFDNCEFTSEATANFMINAIGSADGSIYFNNTDFDFSANTGTNDEAFRFNNATSIYFNNCTITKTANHTDLFNAAGTDGCYVEFNGCDISGFGNITTSVSGHNNIVKFNRCEVASAVVVSGLLEENKVILSGCGNGTITAPPLADTGIAQYVYAGSTVGSTSSYRTNGATDGEQANEYSWEMTTNADAIEMYSWVESPPIFAWVPPNNSPSGATSRGLRQITRALPLATPAALTTDASSTWNGSGVGTKQKIDVTIGDYTLTIYVASGATLNDDDFWVEVFAPDQVGGPVTVKCYLAKPSTTIYVDPKLEII